MSPRLSRSYRREGLLCRRRQGYCVAGRPGVAAVAQVQDLAAVPPVPALPLAPSPNKGRVVAAATGKPQKAPGCPPQGPTTAKHRPPRRPHTKWPRDSWPAQMKVKRRRLRAQRLICPGVLGEQRRYRRRYLIATGGHHCRSRGRRCGTGLADIGADTGQILTAAARNSGAAIISDVNVCPLCAGAGDEREKTRGSLIRSGAKSQTRRKYQ
jgi:hypothetical protein